MRFRLPSIADAKDVILTLITLFLAVSLMISRHDGGLQNIRKASVTVLSYLEQPLSTIRVYRQALNTNTYLHRQNVLLQDELSRLRSAGHQNRILRDLLEFRELPGEPLTPITIVSKEITSLNNSMTISGGTEQGIQPGMPVINSDGLIGTVILATGQYAQVMPYAHSLFRVSARIQDTRAYGIVSWDGTRPDELVLKHIPQTIAAGPGQIVETSGFSNQYPPHIPIGEVTRVVREEGTQTQSIHFRPFVNLHTVAEGFVVHFEPDSSVRKLNEQQQELF